MTITKEHKKALWVVLALIAIYLLFFRKKKSSGFVPNAPIPPPSANPTKVTFATASGATQGGRANQVWTGNEWAQVYGQPIYGQQIFDPTAMMFNRELNNPQFTDATVCNCGKDANGRNLTCEGVFRNGKLVCGCCGKGKRHHKKTFLEFLGF